jgi:TonB family protein
MLYALCVSLLVGLAAVVVERALEVLGGATRWVWASALAVAAGVVLAPGTGLRGFALSSGAGTGGEGAVGLGAVAVAGGSEAGVASTEAGVLAALAGGLDVWLLGLWAAAVTVLLGRWVVRWVGTRRAARQWVPGRLPEGPVLVSRHDGPAVVGVLGRAVVLPRWCLELPDRQRALVMAHEQEHQRARDGLLVSLVTLVVCLVPWNLPFWAYLRRLQEAVEVDCDGRVLRRFPSARREYGELLLEMASRPGSPALAGALAVRPRSNLSRRIRTLVRDREGISRVQVLLLMAAGGLILAASCLVPGPDRDQDAITGPELEAEAADRVPSDPSIEPVFTPFTVAPEVRNRAHVQRALEEEYPAELREAGIGGRAILYFHIDETGEVTDIRVDESSGHPELDQAALRVGAQFSFTPALNRDERVPVWIAIPVVFQARDEAREGREDRVMIRGGDDPPARMDPDELQEEPVFTPFTVAPEVRNRSRIQQALEEAYPSELRGAGIGGTAVVHFFIDETGAVSNVLIDQSSGHSTLDEAALEVGSALSGGPAGHVSLVHRVGGWRPLPSPLGPFHLGAGLAHRSGPGGVRGRDPGSGRPQSGGHCSSPAVLCRLRHPGGRVQCLPSPALRLSPSPGGTVPDRVLPGRRLSPSHEDGRHLVPDGTGNGHRNGGGCAHGGEGGPLPPSGWRPG